MRKSLASLPWKAKRGTTPPSPEVSCWCATPRKWPPTTSPPNSYLAAHRNRLNEPTRSTTVLKMVAASGGIGGDARLHRGDHAALLDGGFTRVAGTGPDAGGAGPQVPDSPGVLHVW